MPPPTTAPSNSKNNPRAVGQTARAAGDPASTGSLSTPIIPVVDLTGDSPEPQPSRTGRGIRVSSQESDPHGQTWPEFLREQSPGRQAANSSNNSGSCLRETSRKRRLGSAASETGAERVRSSGAGSSSRRRGNHGLLETRSDDAVSTTTLRTSSTAARQLNSLRHRERSFTDYQLPKWQPDSEVSQCPICGLTFSFWCRKHHCRKCGRVVCASCSPHRITIPRQFIVRPPESRTSSSTNPRPTPPNAQVINLIDGEDDAIRTGTPSRAPGRQTQPSNPALGGGEEVRLCNPCVPDPNPEPPRRYSVVGSSGHSSPSGAASLRHPPPLFSSSMGSSELYNHLPSFHRPSASLGSTSLVDVDATREFRRHRSRGGASQAESPELHRAGQTGIRNDQLPLYGAFDYTLPPVASGVRSRQRLPQSMGQHPSIPTYPPLTANDPVSIHSRGSHPELGYISVNSLFRNRPDRPLPNPPWPQQAHPEFEPDLCPICNRTLSGDEEAREAHVRVCIQSHTSSNGESSDSPSGNAQMVHFKATEKDCLSEDGAPQECTICMEEYEVGAELTRLLCFCKFHKSCITGWFRRKEECPLHKVLT
ncbi:predicted protein [Uncinocarpus reesii 1704]|uniref:FYVE-type domain-containing protein n=1 Tax=Uncinocarpus reesii (strain UAMH 1704) TaxID=336963 RepID=C4JJ72_UNCRE|nr:uncharacterized protein UREG_01679 [Uncinocarpus reesii 1704]EEP76830.1 predicted protein [Uncinocarpus reesii 1704]